VLILANGTETQAELSSIADQFLDLPVGVHVAKLPLTDKFPNVSVSHIGSTRTLALRSAPMSSFQLAMKRLVDVAISAAALIVLAPVFLVIAAIIKLDSRGPVFFMQSRRGFNQSEFSIWKFRTMTTLDNGDRIEQAKPNDPRITRVGAILRRFNLDELPQLMNVLVGDMSLVGPRPHAVAHDRYYEGIIRRYRRRLNVKPGITGWAQVNGFRGLTNSPHDMRSRIAHDLYYIDHWSITFDLYIMAMTVLSPRAFKNAN
jgi:exopolysaccharide biosynthesis polyprenyl glycosylphosphotransferase